VVIELKILHKTLERTLEQGLEQTLSYQERCAAPEAHLVIFDRDPGKSWSEKIYRREETRAGRRVVVWGM
jgi:hypothetical protein